MSSKEAWKSRLGKQGRRKELPASPKTVLKTPLEAQMEQKRYIAAEVAISKSFKNNWFLLLFWRGGGAGEGVGEQMNTKAEVGRLTGDVGRFSGDLRAHKVPSEEAMGGPRGPLEGPRAVRGRQQDLCQ